MDEPKTRTFVILPPRGDSPVAEVTALIPAGSSELDEGRHVANALAGNGAVFETSERNPRMKSSVNRFLSLVGDYEPELKDRILDLAHLDRAITRQTPWAYRLRAANEDYSRDSFWGGREYKEEWGKPVLFRVRAKGGPTVLVPVDIETEISGLSVRVKRIGIEVPRRNIEGSLASAVESVSENGVPYSELQISRVGSGGYRFKAEKLALPVYISGLTGPLFNHRPAHVFKIDRPDTTYQSVMRMVIDNETRLAKPGAPRVPILIFNDRRHPSAGNPGNTIPINELLQGIFLYVLYISSYDDFTDDVYTPVGKKYRLKPPETSAGPSLGVANRT